MAYDYDEQRKEYVRVVKVLVESKSEETNEEENSGEEDGIRMG